MPSSSKQSTIRLYVKDGKDLIYITAINRRVACYLSPAIRDQLEAGGSAALRDNQAVVSNSPSVDRHSARVLADWMNGYDTRGDRDAQHLTMETVESAELAKILRVFVTAYHMGISRSFRGDALSNTIAGHLCSAKLSATEFKLVHELTDFLPSLFTKLLRSYAADKVSGTLWPQQSKIEAYIDQAGLRHRLAGIERHILNGD